MMLTETSQKYTNILSQHTEPVRAFSERQDFLSSGTRSEEGRKCKFAGRADLPMPADNQFRAADAAASPCHDRRMAADDEISPCTPGDEDCRLARSLAPEVTARPGMSGVLLLTDGRDAFAARSLLADAA